MQEWLLANRLGSFAMGTASGTVADAERSFFTVLLRPPLRRKTCIRRLDETIFLENRWHPLHDVEVAPRLNGARQPQITRSFSFESHLPFYTFRSPGFTLTKRIWMEPDVHAVYLRYRLIDAVQMCRIRVQPLLIVDRGYFDGDSDQSSLKILDRGFAFALEKQDRRWLYFAADAAVKSITVNNWLRTDAAAGVPSVDYIPAALSFALQSGQEINIRIGLDMPKNSDAEESLQNAVEAGKPARVILEANGALPRIDAPANAQHLLIRRATADAKLHATLLSGYPCRSDNGWHTLVALPGLLLSRGEFAAARDALTMLKRHVRDGALPAAFPEGPSAPAYNSADASLWYFIALYEYWQASRDLAFVEQNYGFLLELIMALQEGAHDGLNVDADDALLRFSPTSNMLTWMDRKVGDWPVTPRYGKPVEMQALWYNALMIAKEISAHLGKKTSLEKALATAERVQASINRIFWLPEAGYLADVYATEGLDSSFRANQVIAIGLPFLPFTRKVVMSVLAKTKALLVTPFGLRTLSQMHAAYRGHIGSTPEEGAGAWHNGTVHPWLLWPYVRASLRMRTPGQKLIETFRPLFATLNSGVVGHLSEAFEGDAPHRPVGAPVSAVSLGAALASWQLLTAAETVHK